MTVLLADDASGFLLRAARSDGAHAAICLATTRVLLRDHVIDCCDRCLADVTQIAALAGVRVSLEPVVHADPIAR